MKHMTTINPQALAALSPEVQAYIASLQAKASAPRALALKVTAPKLDEKTGEMKGTSGAISLYGMGKFPITLYRGQWERLLDNADVIRKFIADNAALLSVKEAK
jgi:hypothetical protein